MELQLVEHEAHTLCKLTHPHLSSSRTLSDAPIEIIFLLDATLATAWIWPALTEALTALEREQLPLHPNLTLTKIASATRLSITTVTAATVADAATRRRHQPALLPHEAYAHLGQHRHDLYFAFSAAQLHIDERRRALPNATFHLVFVNDGVDDDHQNAHLEPCLRELANFDNHNVHMTTIACKRRGADATLSERLRAAFTDPNANYLCPLFVANTPEQLTPIFTRLLPSLLSHPPPRHPLSHPVSPFPCEAHNHGTHAIPLDVWFLPESDPRIDPISLQHQSTPLPVRTVPFEQRHFHEIARQSIRDYQAAYLLRDPPSAHRRHRFLARALTILQELDERLQPSQASKIDIDTAFADRLERYDTKEKDDLLFELRGLSWGSNPLDDYNLERMARRFAQGYCDPRPPPSAQPEETESTAAFRAARARFGELLKTQLPLLQHALDLDPYKSAISWETNVDILTDKSLLPNLSDPRFSSQETLLECLPVVGLAVLTSSATPDASPWLVRVQGMSRLTPILDTASLSDMMNHRDIASISSGSDHYEQINTICPILTADTTRALCPILLSKLYQMAMSFQITRSVGHVDRATHLALLASTLVYLLDEPKTGWRSGQIEKVVYTAGALIGHNASVLKGSPKKRAVSFVDYLLNDPAMAVVDAHPSTSRKCQTISKALIAAAVALRSAAAADAAGHDDANWSLIWERIVAEYVGRAVMADKEKRDITKWFVISKLVTKTTLSFEDVFGNDDDVLSNYHSVEHVCRTVEDYDLQAEDIVITPLASHFLFEDLKSVECDSIGPTQWDTLQAFEEEFLPDLEPLTENEDKIRSYLVHAFSHKSSYERGRHEIRPWSERIEQKLSAKLARSHQLPEMQRVGLRALKDGVSDVAREKMHAYMKDAHAGGIVMPLSLQELKRRRKSQHGLDTTTEDVEALGYDSGRGLCRFACQNEKCPRFLIADKRIGEHLANSGEDGGRPVVAFHRTVQRHYTKSVGDIERLILKGACVARGDRKEVVKYIRDAYRPEFRKDIAVLREAYKSLSVVRRFSSGRQSSS